MPGFPGVDHYAPTYRVEVNGAQLSPESNGDVLQLKVGMELNGMSNFSLSFNNWDDQKLQFKYSDSPTFNIGAEIKIYMGYPDELVPMITGQVTGISPKFPASGASTVDVRGTNNLIRLKGSRPSATDELTFLDKADWQIAQTIAQRHGLPIKVTQEGPVHARVVQSRDKDDAVFLRERAKVVEFDIYMQPDRTTGVDTMYFTRKRDGRSSDEMFVFEYEWGKTLIEFTPTISANDQVSSVTVRGYLPETKETISYTATESDLPAVNGSTSGPQAAGQVSNRPNGKEDFIVDSSVISQEEARRLAISHLSDRAYEYNKGSGRVIGQALMRPGDNVDLTGLGPRFNGRYYVEKADHTISGAGYLTQFNVKRPKEG
jgi:phage protein D